MRKTMTRVIEIKSPIQIEVELNHWVEKEKVLKQYCNMI